MTNDNLFDPEQLSPREKWMWDNGVQSYEKDDGEWIAVVPGWVSERGATRDEAIERLARLLIERGVKHWGAK